MGYVERCLWEYRENLAAIEAMREEAAGLRSLSVQEYGGSNTSNVTDPVSAVCERLMSLEKSIMRAERKTKPITKMLEGLSGRDLRMSQMKEILELRYFEHGDKDSVIRKVCVSVKTYYRRCGEIKRLARKYFGEWE